MRPRVHPSPRRREPSARSPRRPLRPLLRPLLRPALRLRRLPRPCPLPLQEREHRCADPAHGDPALPFAPIHPRTQKRSSLKFACTILHRPQHRDAVLALGSTRASVADHKIRAACIKLLPAGCRTSGTRFSPSRGLAGNTATEVGHSGTQQTRLSRKSPKTP